LSKRIPLHRCKQDIVASNIQELLVEPRRGVLPLDYEFRVEEVGWGWRGETGQLPSSFWAS
jgi:hypothetical protein